MTKKVYAILAGAALLAVLGPVLLAQQSPKTINLTLEEAVLRALKSNISLQIAELSPLSSELSVKKAQEKYFPTLSFSVSKRSTENASYSFLDVAGTTNTQKTDSYSGQIVQSTPIGGRFSVALSDTESDSTQKGQTINPRYNTQLSFSYSQPLLRDFGTTMANRDIIVARTNLEISEIQFYKTVQDTLYNVTQAYWSLVYSIENLKVQQTSLQLAKDFLAQNERKVEIGQLAPMDVISAQSEVATREASILAAEASVKANEDQLKMLMNLSAEEESAAALLPADKPSDILRPVQLEDALAVALQKRPDLKMSQLDIRNQNLNLTYAKNQLLPNLSLTAGWQSPGISGTTILYENDNALYGAIIGTVPRGVSDALKDTFKFKYPNWNVSLTLDVPLSNWFSRASLAQAQVALKQTLLTAENTERQAVLEIRNSVRSVQTTYKQMLAFRSARELAEKKLAAEEEKLRVGLSTNYFVLQYQRDLGSARTAELQAIISYNVAQAGLERSMGTSLELHNIKTSELLGK